MAEEEERVGGGGEIVAHPLPAPRSFPQRLASPVHHVDVEYDSLEQDLGAVLDEDPADMDDEPERTEPQISWEYLAWSLGQVKTDIGELQVVANGWL